MNANHARPMLAFWLLAALAAVITSLGLHESGATVEVRGAPAVPVTRTAPAQLVLGETLRAAPAATLPSLATFGHAAAQAGPAVAEARPSPSTKAPVVRPTRTRVQTKTTSRHQAVRSTTSPTVVASPTPVRPGRGKGLAAGQARGQGRSAAGNAGH